MTWPLITRVLFTDNFAGLGGGGIFAQSNNNDVRVRDTEFTGNRCGGGSGAAMNLYQQNLGWIVHQSNFTNNIATISGGAISSTEGNAIVVINSSFYRNNAKISGGALELKGNSSVHFSGDISLNENHATVNGGAIALSSSPLWTVASSALLRVELNTAALGSAVYIYQLIDGGEVDRFQNIEMRNNIATIGGTVYYASGLDRGSKTDHDNLRS